MLLLSADAGAQTGKNFWFAAPDLSVASNGGGTFLDRPIFLRVTTLKKAATVTISEPANPSFTPIVQTIAANSIYSFNLTTLLSQIENSGADVTTNQGLLITSTENILAYYENSAQYNPDIFSLKEKNALGKDFIITSQKKWASYSSEKSAFYVVASEDNTTVTITPSVDLVGHTAASGAYSVVLNKGQVYVARSTSASAANHVGGTLVSADKDVAITMANDLTSPPGGCGDLNGDQLVPSRLAGTTFITLPGGLTIGGISDLVYIYATENSTSVTVNGSVVATINKGSYHAIESTNATQYITTSKPAVVYQVGGFGCETGGGAVPHIDCTGSSTVGVARSSSESFTISLLVKSGGESSFTFNGMTGVINATDFTTVANSGGDWKYAKKSFSTTTLPVGGAAIIKNNRPFHMAVTNGSVQGGTRYGYFSSFSAYTPDADVTNGGLVCGAGSVTVSTSAYGTAYQWQRNGFDVTDAVNTSLLTSLSGTYQCKVTYDNTCPPVLSEIQEVILDDTPPTITTCPADITLAGCENTMPNMLSGLVATDNCAVTSIGQNPVAGVQLGGQTTVTFTVMDSRSNISTCTASVTIAEPIFAPTLAAKIVNPCSQTGVITSTGSNISLDGVNDYVTIPNTLSTSNNFTFESWVYWRGSGVWSRIFDFGNGTSKYFLLSIRSDQNTPVFVITQNGNPNEQRLYSSVAFPQNQWAHIAVTINGATGAGRMYINGVLVGSSSTMTLTPATLGVTNLNYIGRSQYSFDPYLNADLDDMRFWNIARSAADINAAMNTRYPAGYPNIVSYYYFDEGQGTTTKDLSPNAGTGQFFNGVSWVTPTSSPSGSFASYLWSSGSTASSINITSSGNYTLTVTNAAGCTAVSELYVTMPEILNVSTDVISNVSCPGLLDGTALAAASGGTQPYTYSWSTSPTQSGPTATGLAAGTYTVTVTDNVSCTTTKTVTIATNPDTPPVISCPPNFIVATDVDQCTAVVAYSIPTATDNCPNVTVVRFGGDASGSYFATGINAAVYRANDMAGNTSTCLFTMTVQDKQKPRAICNDLTVNLSSSGTATVTAAQINGGSSDNCPAALTYAPLSTSFNCSNLGDNNVTLTVTDGVGNTSVCVATVTVRDVTAPSITTCPSNVTVNDCYGTIPSLTGQVAASDLCGVTAITQSPAAGSDFTPLSGTSNVITYSVTDAGGNITTCSSTVTLIDNTVPVISCPANITVGTDVDQCTAVVPYSIPTATDNCPNVTITRTGGPASGSAFATGVSTVSYRATDAGGNTANCSFTVDVRDYQGPVAVCQNITVSLNVTGNATVTALQVNGGTIDNCTASGLLMYAPITASYNCANLGDNNYAVTVTDAAGIILKRFSPNIHSTYFQIVPANVQVTPHNDKYTT